MATMQDVLRAIENAKAAGDDETVRVLSKILQQPQSTQPQEEPDAGVGDFFESAAGGAKRLFSSALTGVKAPFTSGEEEAVAGIERQKNITERPGASYDAAKETFKQEGILSGVAEIGSQVPTALAEQSSVLASMYAGFKAGAALPLPPQLRVAAGLIGSLIVPFLSMSGSNMQRKAEEDIKAGRPVDVNEIKAYGTGLVQASIERVGLGLSGVSKAMGMSIPQLMKQGGTKATEKLARESLKKTLGMGIGKLAVAESATEVTQQMLERYYAGLSLTDEEAQKEYIEAAYAATLLGPTLGAGSRYKSKGDAQIRSSINELKRKEKEETKAAAREKDAQEGQPAGQEGQATEGQEGQPTGQATEGQEGQPTGQPTGQEGQPTGQEGQPTGQEGQPAELDGSESYSDLKKNKIIKTRKVQQTDTINQDVLDILGIKDKTVADKGLTEDLDLNNPEVIDQVTNILIAATDLSSTNTSAINDYINKLDQKKKTLLAAKVAPEVAPEVAKLDTLIKTKEGIDTVLNDMPTYFPDVKTKKEMNVRRQELKKLKTNIKDAPKTISKSKLKPLKVTPKGKLNPITESIINKILNKFGVDINTTNATNIDKNLQTRIIADVNETARQRYQDYDQTEGKRPLKDFVLEIEDSIDIMELETSVLGTETANTLKDLAPTIQEVQDDTQKTGEGTAGGTENIGSSSTTPVDGGPKDAEGTSTPVGDAVVNPESTSRGATSTTGGVNPPLTESEVKRNLEKLETPIEKQKKTKKPDEPTSNQLKIPWYDRVATAIFSFDAGLNNAVKREMGKAKMSWDVIHKTLNRMAVSQALHAETIAQQFLKYGKIIYDSASGQYEIVDDPNSPSFEKIVKRMDELAASYGIDPKTFRQMVHKNFVAKRAQSLKEYNADLFAQSQLLELQGKSEQAKALWDDNKIIIDLSQDQINLALSFETNFPEINQLHDSWIETKNNLVQFLVESELMTQDQADEFIAVVDVEGAPKETKGEEGGIKTFADTYIPFFREDTDKKPSDYKQTRLGDRGKYHALKGSYEPVADVFDNMQLWMRDSVKRGIMNKKAIDKIDAIEALPEAVQKMIVEVSESARKERGANTIAMSRIEDGKKVVKYYTFSDPMFAQAFSGMDRATLSGLGFFANFSNFLRTNVVLYPLFSIAQLPQDSVSAMFSSGVRNPFMIPLRVLAQFPLTLLDISKTHDIGQRFGFAGGNAYMQNESQADLDINQPGFYNGIRRTMGKVPGLTPQKSVKFKGKELSATGFLSRLAMASDNAVRQAVYEQTMKETNDQALAVNRAFEVINFKRGGANSTVTGLRQVVPFFGAFLQAASVQGRTITGAGITPQSRAKGVQQFLMTGAQLTALTLMYAAMASDEEEYEKLDPTIRDRRFLLGNGAHITLRPDLFTFMFKIIPEHTLQNMVMESEDNRKTWDSIKRALKDVGLFNILPQAIRPAISLMYNYDPLTGRPITPQSAKDRVPERQITAGTSELAKLLSGSINKTYVADNITPIEVDYFLRQYFGYTGGLITMITSSLIDEMDVFDYDRASKSDRDMLASIPGMSAFISREYGNRHTSDYYQLKGEVDKITTAYKDLKDFGYNPKKTQKYVKDNFREITIKPLITSIQNQLGKIRQERNKLLMMPRTMITPDGKKEALDRLYEFERALLSQIKNVRKNIYGTKFEGIDLQEVK